jgi:hypothetical protein
MFRSRWLRGSVAVLSSLSLLLTLVASAFATAEADPFFLTWQRTDLAVNNQVAKRTWMWGPLETSRDTYERYKEAPGGRRMVMYFDKARMEITNPLGNRDDLWHVTNGLLVVELMSGRMQIGHDTFEQYEPARVNVAGDYEDPNGPTYETFAGLRNAAPHPDKELIITRVARNGSLSQDQMLAVHGVRATQRVTVDGIDHRIASVFWDFMNSSGTVWEDGGFRNGKLFLNPFYATGYPLTEAYWAKVLVGGVERDVLMQCFERRCLTFTPSNPQGWKVEAGNVGLHYHTWRYGLPGERELVPVYLVSLEDGGAVGCGDSLVPVQREIVVTKDIEARVQYTLQSLLRIDDQWYGESGLYNALYLSDLTVESVEVQNGTATVNLMGVLASGGTCDDPRISAQIRQTILSVPGISNAVVTVNWVALP